MVIRVEWPVRNRAEWLAAWRSVRRATQSARKTYAEAFAPQAIQALNERGRMDPLLARREAWKSALTLWRAFCAASEAGLVADRVSYGEWRQDHRARAVAMQALAVAVRGGARGVGMVPVAADVLRAWGGRIP